ncbi:hypothetical protein RhiirA4_465530 [Rhizophagus irregularis]|uniref:Pre-mRNA-splicing factor Syf1/CRNKL1-like C-terminal HAT-repeats domain-containing protein n=1 Tax=Rhizophagus irregularis TaxID=588596 RepID=A0A2I1GS73_9GLOM|nr:hypothetical protein RhiirA4_465530 [Rhizophagus irregularis]
MGEDEEFYIKSINNERIKKNYSKKQDHEKDDQKWSKKNVVKQQEFEIRLDNEHIYLRLQKLNFLLAYKKYKISNTWYFRLLSYILKSNLSKKKLSDITYTCKIYEWAILLDKEAKNMSLKYVELEYKLEKIDRTRTLYAYISQFCNLRIVLFF